MAHDSGTKLPQRGDDHDEEANGSLTSAIGLMIYTGTTGDSAVLIYHDQDSLESKFWKWMKYKVESDLLYEWFNRREVVSKGDFAKMVSNLEWHCNHVVTGSDRQGQQLTGKQIKHLIKCVVGIEKEVTREMCEAFAAIEEVGDIKATIQKHHNAICKKALAQKEVKKDKQEKSDGTQKRTAAVAARQELVLIVPVIHQIFGGPFTMLSAHTSHTLSKNRNTTKSRIGLKYLDSRLMHSVLCPVESIELQCEDMEVLFKMAGVPMMKHLQMRVDGTDVLFYESLSRAIWGCESFCCLLGFKVQQEFEDHADWYRERVGTAFFGCVTGEWAPSVASADSTLDPYIA
jgi:hypothetical protein